MKSKIAHPLFLISLLLLILNDWYFKIEYHNWVTGKLSDFAGLIAFPYFFSVLFPARKKQIHLLTALFFLIWNSTWIQPFLDFANSYYIPIGRTVDFTDHIALFSILVSYRMLQHQYHIRLRPVMHQLLILISCFAFIATSIPPKEKRTYVDVNQPYAFDLTKSELVSRINMIQMREVDRLNQISNDIIFDAEKNIFHYEEQTDTLAILLDHSKIKETDTLSLNTLLATLIITGEKEKSQITLLKVTKLVPQLSDKNYQQKAIKEFEKRVIKKIKKYQ